MVNQPETYLNAARVAELWAAVKTELSKLTTPEAVASAITTALANYMTREDVDAAVAGAVADAAHLRFEAVDALPETGEANVIYLVPDAEDSSVKQQSMWINDAWVSMGSTRVDLSNVWSKDELRVMTSEELAAILV